MENLFSSVRWVRGFTTELQREILKKLQPLQTTRCPFREVPDYNKPSRFRPNPPKAEVTWVKPRVLDTIRVPSFCKTSGSTGLHIYIPLGAKYTYEESKEFGRVIAKAVHREIPEFTSIERLTSNRNGKVYIDFLQNRPQATVACAYSLRPKPGAPVSMPLDWREVKKGLKITDFNIRNAIARLKETGDIFRGVLGKGIDMAKALSNGRLHGI